MLIVTSIGRFAIIPKLMARTLALAVRVPSYRKVLSSARLPYFSMKQFRGLYFILSHKHLIQE